MNRAAKPDTPHIRPHIRVARESDAAQLYAAERETARVPGRLLSQPEELLESVFVQKIRDLSKVGSYLVAENDGKIVGHALLEPAGTLVALAHVRTMTIVVHPGNTGNGIGTALLRSLLEWARSAEIERVELRVRETNVAAIHLYKKCGFSEETRFSKRVKLMDGTFIDDIGMTWFRSTSYEPHA
jgi:RimJ/RimL family protein N-acetyltransferase